MFTFKLLSDYMYTCSVTLWQEYTVMHQRLSIQVLKYSEGDMAAIVETVRAQEQQKVSVCVCVCVCKRKFQVT